MNAETLLSLLPEQRRHIRLRPRRRGRYRDRKRTKLSSEELIRYLVTNKLRTTGDLRRHRHQDAGCPLVGDFITTFGKWSTAVEKAHGKQTSPFAVPNDPQYMLGCVHHFGLWTQCQYAIARRLRPDVVPSTRQVRRVWGGFSNLLYAAKTESVKKTFEEYLKLERRLGRIPSAVECRNAGLDLSPLRRLLGTKWDVDALLALRKRADDQIQKAG